jgi:hypothetical protein
MKGSFMRKVLVAASTLLAAVAAIGTLAVPQSALAGTVSRTHVTAGSRTPGAILRGGMVRLSSGMASSPWSALAMKASSPAALPSCHAITYRGNAGAIHVQTSKSGYVAWGIYLYNAKLNKGPWIVDVYVAKRRVDHKDQTYPPHGSVNPKDAKKGKIFHITAKHYADSNHTWYYSVPNECVIP